MKQILVGLQASYKTSDNRITLKNREEWICKGLSSLSYIENFIDKSDCYYFDNTVNSESELPESIKTLIPKSAEKIYDTKANQYGIINPGAGCIEMLRYVKDKIKNYDWYVHHEPRTVLENGNFFNTFLEEPQNLFRIGGVTNPNDHKQVWTGTYFINTKDLLKYLDWVDLDVMCKQSISIESNLKFWLDASMIPFKPITHAGILWNDKTMRKNYHI